MIQSHDFQLSSNKFRQCDPTDIMYGASPQGHPGSQIFISNKRLSQNRKTISLSWYNTFVVKLYLV